DSADGHVLGSCTERTARPRQMAQGQGRQSICESFPHSGLEERCSVLSPLRSSRSLRSSPMAAATTPPCLDARAHDRALPRGVPFTAARERLPWRLNRTPVRSACQLCSGGASYWIFAAAVVVAAKAALFCWDRFAVQMSLHA